MSQPFCKLYEFEDIGQVLVMLGTNADGNAEIKVVGEFLHDHQPALGLSGWDKTDADKNWEIAEAKFQEFTSEHAYDLCVTMRASLTTALEKA